ncbi:MAG: DUF2189 domain-containing protein [Cognatishimia sp.]
MHEAPKPLGVPDLGAVEFSTLKQALALGWHDFRARPGYGLFFAALTVVGGWLISWVTLSTGQSYWLVFAAIGFPLIGPFAAVGLYEVSHRLQMGYEVTPAAITHAVLHQRKRQLPSLCSIIVTAFLFWFFLAHMIFALFLGLTPMTNISSSFEVFLQPNGLMMLAFGTAVGAIFAALLYSLTVFGMPLLLDRDIDFVTAMLTSLKVVTDAPVVMLSWGAFVAAVTFVSMIPGFLGLFIAIPIFGHASWHLYAQVKH